MTQLMRALYLTPAFPASSASRQTQCYHETQRLALPRGPCVLFWNWFLWSTWDVAFFSRFLIYFVHAYVGTMNLAFCICVRVCLHILKSDLRTRPVSFQLQSALIYPSTLAQGCHLAEMSLGKESSSENAGNIGHGLEGLEHSRGWALSCPGLRQSSTVCV